MKEYDALVFIGRLQPMHNGHVAVIDKALQLAEKVVIVLGSADSPQTPQNPLTLIQRIQSVKMHYPDDRVMVVAQPDYRYDLSRWVSEVITKVNHAVGNDLGHCKIGLIGFQKDGTGYYLKLFPQWARVAAVPVGNPIINATDIRKALFEENRVREDLVPQSTIDVLNAMKRSAFLKLKDWYDVTRAYRKSWESAPFPPTFVTTDAVVVQGQHVLLVKRGSHPGMGLGALPGGFLEQSETVIEGTVRELIEETKIDINRHQLLESIVGDTKVFDDPWRSDRGRTLTHATLFDLDWDLNRRIARGNYDFTRVRGGDDAAKATWIPIAELDRSRMFEDHYDIIMKMLQEKK